MTAKILDGKPVALELSARAREELQWLRSKCDVTPTLTVVRVGEDESSLAYERSILRTGKASGIVVESVSLAEQSNEDELRCAIEALNAE